MSYISTALASRSTIICFRSMLIILLLGVATIGVQAQTTEFTYQGQLQSSSVQANGSYDFQFNVTDGNGNVIQTVEALGVSVSNGIFTTRLVFNFSTFVTKAGVNLQVGVRQLPTEPYALLGPPQPFSATRR